MLAGVALCWASCSWSPSTPVAVSEWLRTVVGWGGRKEGGDTGSVFTRSRMRVRKGAGAQLGRLLSLPRLPGHKQLGLLLLGSQGQTWPLWHCGVAQSLCGGRAGPQSLALGVAGGLLGVLQ